MRYTVTRQIVQIVGALWQPDTIAATEMTLTAYDMENIVDPASRDDVEQWLVRNSGDFSHVIDFRADFDLGDKHIEHNWKNEKSEMTFNDMTRDIFILEVMRALENE